MLTTPKCISSAQSPLKNFMAEAIQSISPTGHSNRFRGTDQFNKNKPQYLFWESWGINSHVLHWAQGFGAETAEVSIFRKPALCLSLESR